MFRWFSFRSANQDQTYELLIIDFLQHPELVFSSRLRQGKVKKHKRQAPTPGAHAGSKLNRVNVCEGKRRGVIKIILQKVHTVHYECTVFNCSTNVLALLYVKDRVSKFLSKRCDRSSSSHQQPTNENSWRIRLTIVVLREARTAGVMSFSIHAETLRDSSTRQSYIVLYGQYSE